MAIGTTCEVTNARRGPPPGKDIADHSTIAEFRKHREAALAGS
jgi:hypothetical protein